MVCLRRIGPNMEAKWCHHEALGTILTPGVPRRAQDSKKVVRWPPLWAHFAGCLQPFACFSGPPKSRGGRATGAWGPLKEQ